MYRHIRPHLPQILRYLAGGFGAAGLELSSYKVMLLLDMWYFAAGTISAGIGLISAFLLHKYFAFRKRERVGTGKQAVRYAILQAFNAVAQIGLLVLFVEYFGVEEFIAKILGIGVTVSWNYFLYKFFVYA